MSIAKVAVLAAGLAAAVLVATINPPPAQAFPSKQQDCTNCHGVGTPAGTVNAVPSTTTPVAGATYTVLVTEPANAADPTSDTGYWIANSTAAGVTGTTTGVYAGADGTAAATRTATMTAPAAAGTYYYKVWAVKGHSDATGVTNFALYSITVAGAPVVVTTTTALAVTPASPVVAPASPSLTATVTGTGAAGTVEFFNGTATLGTSPVVAGVASKALTGVAAGSYSYKAVFTPTDAALFTPSTSLVVAYLVTAAPPVVVTTTTALAVTPVSPVVAPASPSLKATVTGAGAAGLVEFFNGTTSLGTSPVAAGLATKALTGVGAGTYNYKAVFTPTDAALFTSSTSLVIAFVVTAAPPVVLTTTTALAVTPASPVVAPASPSLTATVTGAGAAGLVEFFNGTTSLGTSPVAAGIATKALVGLGAGTYNYKAVFTPTDAALFTPSTSLVVAYTVTAAPPVVVTTTTALAVTPVSPVVAPASLTLTATVTGAGAAGLVEFFNGTTSLGTPSAITGGVATKALVGLVAGDYSYTAAFTPTDAALFTASTSSAVAFVVTPAPVAVPVASFTASATSGNFPLPVTFTDTSINTPTSWAWDLGDGTTSIVQNPTVTYTAAGTYTVTLIASNASGASAMVTQTITVTTPPPVVISPVISSLSPNKGAIGDIVTINGTGFGTVGTMTFNGVTLVASTWSDTAITFVAPIGTGRDAVTVITSDGTVSNTIMFRFVHVK